MNKMEEIKYWAEQRMVAETRTKYAIERIKELDQLAEAEKPKLRHGDFGIVPKGGWKRIRLFKSAVPDLSDKPDSGENEDYNLYGICNTEDFIKFGNIFGLMKDWSEDFKGFTVLGQYNFVGWISIKNPDRIHLKIVGGESTYTEVELYELWCNLGHAIIELKRNKQKSEK